MEEIKQILSIKLVNNDINIVNNIISYMNKCHYCEEYKRDIELEICYICNNSYCNKCDRFRFRCSISDEYYCNDYCDCRQEHDDYCSCWIDPEEEDTNN